MAAKLCLFNVVYFVCRKNISGLLSTASVLKLSSTLIYALRNPKLKRVT